MKKYIFIILAVILPFYMTAQSYNVGNFSGSFDISPIGSATYTIPIEIPPGTAGLQPSVGITFNSMAGDGIMGKGFSLTGSSCISRSANTLFHNGYIKDISFNSSDQYTLDGSRLIYYGNSEYRTEINPVSRIKIFSPNTSSTYFEMETKDGLKMEYGKTIDSKLFEQGNSSKQVAIWMLNKVIDQQGNYYTYTYEKVDANGEMRIKQIDYTGSINSNPYCSIRFTYTTRFYDVNLTYISGTKTKESKILSSIEVYYNSSLFRRYTMQYSNDSSSDYIYLLSQITVSGQNNESLKPITFNWYKNSNFKQDQVIYDQSYYAKTYVNKADITLGDFNGDGRTDFIATPKPGATWTGWRLFLANADGNGFTYSGSGSLPDGLQEIIPGDFNGDGITDFIARRQTVVNYSLELEAPATFNAINELNGSTLTFKSDSSELKSDLSLFPDSLSGNNSNQARASTTLQNYFVYYGTGSSFTYISPALTTLSRPHGTKVADFNGDGAMDLFVYYTSKSGTSPDYEIYSSGFSGGTMTAFKSTLNGRLSSDVNWNRVEVWDFNGDGLAEVMNLHDNGYNYFTNNGYGNISKSRDSSFPNKNHVISFGDFNGDRKIDMLLTGWNGTQWGDWQTHLSTGLDFERFFFPKKFDTYSKAIFVCDLNGDGADDFFAVDKSSGSMTVMNYYLSINNGLDFKGYSGTGVYALNSWNFYPINSRGDGRMGFLVTSAPYSWTGYQLYMPVKDYTNLLKSTADSYGNTTTITYKPMTDTSVYTKNDITGGSAAVSGYDCLSFTAPFKLVSEISSSNGVGSTNSVTYKYENAKVFKRGRGFLGFSKMTVTDQRTAIQTAVTNEFSSTYYQPAIKSVVKMYSYTNKKLAQTDYVNTLMQSSGSIFYLPASTSESSYEPSASSLIKSANTAYTYDSYSNILTQTTTFGSGETNKITNTYNNNTSNWLIGQLTNCETKVTANGKTQTSSCEYLYDGGLLKSKTSNPTSTNKIKTTYTYDTYGNISMQKTEANNEARTETFTYNSGRFIASHTNHLNQKTSFVYELASGLVTSKTDPDGITYSYTYDGFGNIKNESNSLGRSVATSWAWANGDPTYSIIKKQESFNNGQVVNTWFDSFGRELQSNHKDFSNKLVYTKNIYNELGQITSTSEPYFSNSTPVFQTNQYDTYGRLSQQTTPLGTITYTYSGNTTTINDGTKGYTSTRITDLSGKTTSVTDSGGETITYTYGPTGDPDKITCGNAVYTMKYDEVGRQTELNDPNIGVTTYTYNGWGDLLEQTTPGGKTEKYIYASDGKIMSYQRGSEVFSYTYDTKYIDRVKSTKCGNIETSFTYGNYGKITSKTKTVDNKSFTFAYNYNSQDQLASMTYPNSKTIAYNYVNGELTQITWQANNSIVWQKTDANAKGQNLTINLGNGIQESFLYNNQGIPTSIKAAKSGNTLLNIAYSQIDSRGNIGKREDLIKGQTELFAYDPMNRLSTGMQYANNGNITSKSGITNYQYKSSRPHAVTQVDIPSSTNLQSVGLSITYNSINRPQELSVSSSEKYTFTYAPGKERIKSVYTKNNAVVQTKYYVGPYEEIAKGATIQKNYYIYVAGEIAAVYTEGTSDAGMYYFHKDHQGSPWLITNSSGSEVQRLNFDAWGRRRDPNNWNSYSNLAAPKFDRGYTGHEHLDMFELINMNARLYDPVIGRFLSPDPQIQLTDASQAYNRYSYAMNNPISYKDPNGESFILLAAIIGGWLGMGTAMVTSDKDGWGLVGDMFKGLAIGAASGAAGAWAGGAVAGAVSWGGFVNGAMSGLASGYASGFVGGAASAWTNGAKFWEGYKTGLIGGGIGAGISAVTGGLTRGFTDLAKGYNFWNGSKTSFYKIYDQSQEYKSRADAYNSSSSASLNDEMLKDRSREAFNINEGDFGIDRITTKSGKFGMTNTGLYYNQNTGETYGGFTYSKSTGISDVHISPYAANGDAVTFEAIAGHEFIHAYHNYTLGDMGLFSESVAYQYSANVYMRAGQYDKALPFILNRVLRSKFHPVQYNIPFILKSFKY